jgi:hypothetical protein
MIRRPVTRGRGLPHGSEAVFYAGLYCGRRDALLSLARAEMLLKRQIGARFNPGQLRLYVLLARQSHHAYLGQLRYVKQIERIKATQQELAQ